MQRRGTRAQSFGDSLKDETPDIYRLSIPYVVKSNGVFSSNCGGVGRRDPKGDENFVQDSKKGSQHGDLNLFIAPFSDKKTIYNLTDLIHIMRSGRL